MTPPPGVRGAAPRDGADGSSDPNGNRQLWQAADSGWVLMVELIAATFTWGGIGWLLDRWLGTAPWFMITGFVIGWSTGIYLAWVRHGGEQKDQGGEAATEGEVGAGEQGA